MSGIVESILAQARLRPDSPAICGNTSTLSYVQLVDELASLMDKIDVDRVGIFLENSPAWAIADLALLAGNKICVPLPGFFSDSQIGHIIKDAGIQQVITDKPERLRVIHDKFTTESIIIAGQPLSLVSLAGSVANVLPECCKITYTSGSSGTPKGVCLSKQSIERVTESLCDATDANPQDNSLALLPLSTLLENIGSIYVPLTAGGQSTLIPGDALGIHGSSSVFVADLLKAIVRIRPGSLILTPQLLELLVTVEEAEPCLPDSLRFIAVGGAVVSTSLLERAAKLGLPVFQGYGLSEAASVVSLNTQANNKIGSVGKVLAHNSLRIDAAGEIHLRGALFEGYLHDQQGADDVEWATGDVGYLDEQGYLFITGRQRNVFITTNGRNVSPEWVESELAQHPGILQAAVFGESQPFNVAVLVCHSVTSYDNLTEIVAETNKNLPDYAQIKEFVRADSSFNTNNGEANVAGVIQRQRIYSHYEQMINDIYSEKQAV